MPAPNLQPTLSGPRLMLRPIEPADWRDMYAAAADPEIWAVHPQSDRYKEAVFRKYFDGAIASKSAFAIIDRNNDKIIGSSRYEDFDEAASEIEIGWTFLARKYWGGSYNCELKKLMLDHAFSFVDTVVFWVGVDNLRSRRAVEKIGGELREGVFRRQNADDRADYVVYAISKSEFSMQ